MKADALCGVSVFFISLLCKTIAHAKHGTAPSE